MAETPLTASEVAKWMYDNRGNSGTPEYQRMVEVFSSLTSKRPNAIQRFGQGTVHGAARLLTLPADLVSRGSSLGGIQDPSRTVLNGLRELGLTYGYISDVTPQHRPYALAGEVVGESAVPIGGMVGAAKSGMRGGRILAPIMESAATSPGAFVAGEMPGVLGAAGGRAMAESVAPGNELLGIGAEIAGGVFNPLQTIRRLTSTGSTALKSIREYRSPAARERRVGREIAKGIKQSGENVDEVLASLEGAPVVRSFSSGEKAGSPFLMGMERGLMNDIPQINASHVKRWEAVTKELDAAYKNAIGGGNPQAVRKIAQERSRWFRQLLEARFQAAQGKAMEASTRISPTMDRAAANISARNILTEALDDVDSVEKGLWNKVDRTVKFEDAPNLRSQYDNVRNEILQEEGVPSPIGSFIARLKRIADPEDVDPFELFLQPMNQDEARQVTSGELLRFVSRVRRLQRAVRAQPDVDWSLNRHLRMLADGAMDDMADLPYGLEARDFSRAKNQHFTHGTVGKLLGYEAAGGLRVDPMLTLESSISGGGMKAAVAAREIEGAIRFAAEKGARSQELSGLPYTEEVIRYMARTTVDRQTGQVNPRLLSKFLETNEELLKDFPTLRGAFTDAQKAQQSLDIIVKSNRVATQAAASRAVFSEVAGFEDPTRAMASIMTGPTPLKSYSELARMVSRKGSAATEGLRSATFDWLFEQSRRSDGMISGTEMRRLLTSKVNGDSLLNVMQKGQVLDSAQREALFKVVRSVERVEEAMRLGRPIGNVLSGVNAIDDLVIRMVGANLGAHGAVLGSSGTPLVAAAAGVRTARYLFEKIPGEKARDVLINAMENPQFMAKLIRGARGGSSLSAQRRLRQLDAYLWQALLPSSITEEKTERRP